MIPADFARRGIKVAAGIEVATCGCPSLWLILKDEGGTTFAVACLSPEVAIEIAREVTDAAETVAAAAGLIPGKIACEAVH